MRRPTTHPRVDMNEPPKRIIDPGPDDGFYWASGADGQLRIAGCNECDRLHHPPSPVCPHCHSQDRAPRVVSGRGTVAAFTINHQPFMDGFEPPYAFGFVEIHEDPEIRLGTNIIGCDLDTIHIGMEVEVLFEKNGEYFVPLFMPSAAG